VPSRIQVDLFGQDELVVNLEVLFTKLETIGDSIHEAARYMAGNVKTQFNRGDAGGWNVLAESTAYERERLGYKAYHPILRREDDLYDAAVMAFEDLRFRSLGYTREEFVYIDVVYAGLHQYGGVTPKGFTVPARPFIDTFELAEILAVAVERHVRYG
jgi:hypothetical protein